MKFYGENNFDLLRKKFDAQLQDSQLVAKLEELFTPKPFSVRWYVANIAAQVLGFVCNMVSVVTAFALFSYALFLSFAGIMDKFWAWGIAATVAIILCVIIEIFKRYSSNHFLQAAIQYRQFHKTLFGLTLFCCILSVATSFWGAKIIPSNITSAPIYQAPILENLDSIQTLYAKNIGTIEEELQRTRKENTKPTGIRSSARPFLFALQNQKTKLQNTQQEGLTAARLRNENALILAEKNYKKNEKIYENDTKHDANLLVWVSLSLEILYLCCVFFSWLYYWNCYKERCAIAQDPSPTPSPDQNPPENDPTKIVIAPETSPQILPNEAPETPHNNENSSTKIVGNLGETNKTMTIILGLHRKCSHCQAPYIHKHHKQKYCKDACRLAAWEQRNNKKLVLYTA